MLFNPILVILGLLAFLLCPYAITAWKTTRYIWKCLTFEEADGAIPAEMEEVFRVYQDDLETNGFHFVKSTLLHNGRDEDLPAWGLVFQDATATCYAGLAVLQPFRPSYPILVTLTSFFADGTVLRTSGNKYYGTFQLLPNEVFQNFPNGSIESLWQAHQAKIDELAVRSQPVVLTCDQFLEKLVEHSIQGTELAVRRGEARWVEAGKTFRWGFKPATKLTCKIGLELLFKKSPPALANLSSETAIELEVQAFLREIVPKPVMAKKKRGWLALGSLALFVAIYATKFDPTTLVAFLGALILHEGGHLLAMLWFGYRAPAVLFIPYLGALATARKEHATLTEKVWISLAGPLPGLILGIGIVLVQTWGSTPESWVNSWYAESNLWRTASSILIGLNLFNLLPIYPLDGGQIVELLVFSHNPYLGLIYKSLGVVLLLLIGLVSPLLFAFAIIIALTIPTSFRTARWFAKLRKELRGIAWQDDEATARLVFSRLQAVPKLSPWQKMNIALGIWDTQRQNSAPWSSRWGLSLIYLVSLLAGIIGGIYSFFPSFIGLAQLARDFGPSIVYMFQGPEGMMRNHLKKADQAIQQDPNDLKAYLSRAITKRHLGDFDGALADVNYVVERDPKSPEAYRHRSMIYERLGETAKAQEDGDQANKLMWTPKFQQAHAAIKKNPKDAKAYVDRGYAKAGLGDSKSALQDYTQALKIDPNNESALFARSGLYQSQKNYQAALTDLNQAIKLKPDNPVFYGFRAAIYRSMNQPEKAAADEQKLKTMYGDDYEAEEEE